VIKVLVSMIRRSCAKTLRRRLANESDLEVRLARDGIEALDQLEKFRPDVITLDVHMPE
jgi:two-component system chemotaxis response regulator CheB